MRLAVLRLCNLDRLVVKEPYNPCVFIVRPSDPLADAQLRRLVTASPWNPIMTEATVGAWDATEGVFDVEIHTIELMPKIAPPPKPRRKCDARKQNTRMLHM